MTSHSHISESSGTPQAVRSWSLVYVQKRVASMIDIRSLVVAVLRALLVLHVLHLSRNL